MGANASSISTQRAGKYHYHDKDHYGDAAVGGHFGRRFKQLSRSVNVDRNVKEFSRFWRNGGSLLDIMPKNSLGAGGGGSSHPHRSRRIAHARRKASGLNRPTRL